MKDAVTSRGPEASAGAQGRHDQSLDEGSGDGEKEGKIFLRCTRRAGCRVIGGEGKSGHVRDEAKARYVTSHELSPITKITEV